MEFFQRKWRPSFKCIYVIPEIHGNFNSLNIILGRILPLRKHIGQDDIIIFLGDYIDKDNYSFEVVEKLIQIKNEYQSRAIFLRGNHEQMLLDALKTPEQLDFWIKNCGTSTLKSYSDNHPKKPNPFSIPHNRLPDLFGPHLEFFNSLKVHHVIDNYTFFHGGFNYIGGIENTLESTFINDTETSKWFKNKISELHVPKLPDDLIYVGAHNYKSKVPFIHQKYFMLGGGAPDRLFVLDLNSMACSAVKSGKANLYKFNLSISDI